MATKAAVAIVRERAIKSLKETSTTLAETLGIDAPDLDIYFKDKDLLEAETLKVIAEFNDRVLTALTASAGKKKGAK